MFTSFLAAARYRDLVALVFFAWKTLHPGAERSAEAPVVADAIAWSVLTSDAPFSDDKTVALMAEFAWRESNLHQRPCAPSAPATCADSGLAHGYWQLHQTVGEAAPREQAAAWLALLNESARLCPAMPIAMLASGSCHFGRKLARFRLHEAERALNAWNAAEKATDLAGSAGTPSPADAALAVPPAAQPTTAGRQTDSTGDPSRARPPIDTAGAEL
jgi:hypothetical protein